MDTFLRSYAETRAFTLGQPVHARLVDRGQRVLFLRAEPRSPSLRLFEHDVASGEERLLLAAEDLLGGEEQLSDAEKARRERTRLQLRGLVSFAPSDGDDLLMLPLGGRVFFYRRSTKRHFALAVDGVIDPQLSPDGKHVAFVREHDLYLAEIATGAHRALTTHGSETRSFGLAEFIAQEEMGRMFGYVFSPDGRAIIYEEVDTRAVEALCIADPLRPEKEPLRLRYPRAGKNNAAVKLWIRALEGGEPEEIVWDKEAFPYLATFTGKHTVSLLVQSRDQRHECLYAWRDGALERVLEEKDSAWINLWRGVPCWSDHGLLWISERSGRATLELAGAPILQDVVELVHADGAYAYALASKDPTSLSLHEIDLANASAREIPLPTAERTVHVQGARLIDTAASRTELRRTAVYDREGRALTALRSVAEAPPLLPNATWQVVNVNGREHHAVVLRPYAKHGKLPVLLSVYGGPHHLHVSGMREPYFREQWLAEQGYAVVAIDNRGTPRRGREWERAIALDFATVPVEDQVGVLQALCDQHPELDRDRIGVFGWSFGGYLSALLLMRRPDVLKSAVAGAPVVDWQDYDTHYTERYLQLPSTNPEGYAQSSLLTHARALERPLLLIHGTADDNVYFFHTLKLSDALTRHGISHNVLPLAGATHMVAEPVMVERLWQAIAAHFRKTL